MYKQHLTKTYNKQKKKTNKKWTVTVSWKTKHETTKQGETMQFEMNENNLNKDTHTNINTSMHKYIKGYDNI